MLGGAAGSRDLGTAAGTSSEPWLCVPGFEELNALDSVCACGCDSAWDVSVVAGVSVPLPAPVEVVVDCPSMVPSSAKTRCPPNMTLPRFEKDRLAMKSSSRRLSVGMGMARGAKGSSRSLAVEESWDRERVQNRFAGDLVDLEAEELLIREAWREIRGSRVGLLAGSSRGSEPRFQVPECIGGFSAGAAAVGSSLRLRDRELLDLVKDTTDRKLKLLGSLFVGDNGRGSELGRVFAVVSELGEARFAKVAANARGGDVAADPAAHGSLLVKSHLAGSFEYTDASSSSAWSAWPPKSSSSDVVSTCCTTGNTAAAFTSSSTLSRCRNSSSQSSSRIVVVDELAAARPESRFQSPAPAANLGTDTVRSAGCSSVGGAIGGGGGATTTGWWWLEGEVETEDDDEEVGRALRDGFRGGMGIGGSAATVFSYRKAMRLVSSLKDGLGTTGLGLCRTLLNLVGAMTGPARLQKAR